MRTGLIFLISLFAYLTQSFSDAPEIIITEIYRDPPGCENCIGGGLSHEYVEIMNISEKSICLDGLWLTDGSECDSVAVWDIKIPGYDSCIYGSNRLAPSQCAVILDSDYRSAVCGGMSGFTIAKGTLLLTVNDNDIGNGLQSDDGIILYKGSRNRIDTVVFCAADTKWTAMEAPSEKIHISEPVNKEGFSITLTSFLFDKPRYSICEKGVTPGIFEGFTDGWFAEWNKETDTTCDNKNIYKIRAVSCDTLTDTEAVFEIKAGGQILSTEKVQKNRGIYQKEIDVKQDAGDIWLTINGKYSRMVDCRRYDSTDSCIRITEINPKANTDDCEWIEIANSSLVNSFDLAGWQFGNSDDSVPLTLKKTIVPPGGCVLLCKDSALLLKKYRPDAVLVQPERWHTLNNSADTILLVSETKILADMVEYDSRKLKGWNYQSLVRLQSASKRGNTTLWRINNVPTPGTPDKLTTQSAKVNISPIPFSPNGDGKNDLLTITVPSIGQSLTDILIYGFDGKKIKEFSMLSGGQLTWDGVRSDGKTASVGPFFVVAEMTVNGKKKVFRNKGILWR